jgi:serine/threonine protein kinase
MSGKPYSEREARAARLLKDLLEEQARDPSSQARPLAPADSPSPPAAKESTRTASEDFLLGQIALEWKLLTEEQLEESRRLQREARAQERILTLGETLLQHGLLKPDDLLRLLKEQSRRSEGQPEIRRYEIRERLGEGATAIVYGAWDRELRRPVAVKVLREGPVWSDVQRHRFHREAQTAASLSHPNVVAMYDAGEAQGRPYLVMELVEGKLLSEVFREQKLPSRELLQLLEKVCRGVAAAHAKGIVHRDLKPANILITPSGEPKVGDFGLAHVLESSVQLTRTGTSLGTPLYMSPEQVGGHSKDITPRTDVYGLGAVMYEAVTGRPPHTGETLQEIYSKILGEEPPTPSTLRPNVSSDVQTIVLKALKKNPRERYPTAEALADDLKRHLDGDPILARPISRAGRIWRNAFRYRAVLLPSISALLLGVLLVGSWFVRRESKVYPIASLESVQGEVTVASEAGTGPARASQLLSSGHGLMTGKGSSWAVLTFLDGSRVEIGPETTIEKFAQRNSSSRGPSSFGNYLYLAKGSLRAEVVRQPEKQPMILATAQGEARVPEATIRMAITSGVKGSTRLDVVNGNAQFVLPEGTSLEIPTASFLVVGPDIKPMPTPIPTDEMTRLARDSKTLTGTRRFVNRKSGKALAVQRGSKENGACVIQRAYRSEDSQLWRLQTAGDGLYRIENVGSGKALDMLGGGGGGGGDGTQVIQSDQVKQPHQQWRITSVGGGYFRVTNSKSGRALSVLGKSTDEDAYVVQWGYDGDPSQQWMLERP